MLQTEARPKIGLWKVLRYRNFSLLAGGQFVSMLGDQAYTVALAWQVQLLNPGPEALAGVLACYAVSQLIFLLVAGAVVDRLPRRTILLLSDLGRAALVLAVAFLGRQGLLEVWHLAVLSALNGAVAAFFLPARTSIQPDLLPKEALLAGNSLMGFAFQTSLLAGPLLGAGLVSAFAPASAFAFDALTFAISATCLVFMRYNPAKKDTPASKPNLLTEVKVGFSYISKSVWLWLTILLFGVLGLTLAGPLQALGPVLVREDFGGKAEIYGLLLSVRSLAALLATLVIARFSHLQRRGLIAYLCVALAGLGVALVGLGGEFGFLWLCLLGISGMGIGFACFDVIWNTVLQEMVPAEYLGRVYSLDMLGSFCMIPLGLALAGFLASFWSAGLILLTGGALSFALAALGLMVREIRRLA
jgi:DHA3 family tetracycline resistance protein-like MFS transporter